MPAITDELSALLTEVASTKETAQKIANDGPSEGADVPRVLAGLIAHLAEQVERLAAESGSAGPETTQREEP